MYQTPQLSRVRSSCWINSVTLKHAQKHTRWLLAWSLAFLSIVWLCRWEAGRRHSRPKGTAAPLFGSGCANFVTSYPSLFFTPHHLSPPPPSCITHSTLQTQPPYPTTNPFVLSMHCSPPLSFIWIPQWGLFVQWLLLHCAAEGSRVNGQANEFSPSANCGVRTHTHTRALWGTRLHAPVRKRGQIRAPIKEDIFFNWTSFIFIPDLWPGDKGLFMKGNCLDIQWCERHVATLIQSHLWPPDECQSFQLCFGPPEERYLLHTVTNFVSLPFGAVLVANNHVYLSFLLETAARCSWKRGESEPKQESWSL